MQQWSIWRKPSTAYIGHEMTAILEILQTGIQLYNSQLNAKRLSYHIPILT